MTFEIGLLFAIVAVALAAFAFEWVPADVVALGVMLTLVLTGLVEPADAFAGFGSDTVMMILGLLILTAALLKTGVVEMAGRALLRFAGEQPQWLLPMILFSVALLSAFISNTAATAFFLPIVMGVAARARISPSKLLMPLAFASILTSSVTLISTSTNIVVSGLMQRNGMAPMGMFELAPVGIPIAVVGLAYVLLGRRIIPDRSRPQDLVQEFGLREYLSEILVMPDSKLAGKTLAESGLGRDLDLTVIQIIRDKDKHLAPRGDTLLQPNDILLVEGRPDEILKIKDTAGIEIKADVKLSDPDLQSEDMRLAEVILMPRSPLIGRTLKNQSFRERYGLQVLAINAHGQTIRTKISQVRLQMGDVLLVQGYRGNIEALQADTSFRILGALENKRPNVGRAPLAIAIFALALIAATVGIVPLPVAVLVGALLAFVTRCITPEEAYREVEWKALVLIGSMLSLGVAMEETGAAEYLAGHIVGQIGGASPVWLLAGFFALTVALTQPMSNQAAAIVIVPIAVQTAVRLGLNPRAFVMMVAVAASCSYLTPLEPSCLMVYGPGRYRFADFLKFGALLTVLVFVVALVLVPLVWPVR